MIDLIYCAGGNSRLAQIAIDAGFLYGSQMPDTVYHDLYFADQDWRNPNLPVYLSYLERHKPYMATALDWERDEQLGQVLEWAEYIAAIVEEVIIIPKVMGGINRIPETIGGKPVRLGFSVPTGFSGTELPVWEFGNRPVHLLGGSPQVQMQLVGYLNVKSADGNMSQKMAMKYCQFWTPGTARYARNRWWPTLKEANDGELWAGKDAPYEAFRRSCNNILAAWGIIFKEMGNERN